MEGEPGHANDNLERQDQPDEAQVSPVAGRCQGDNDRANRECAGPEEEARPVDATTLRVLRAFQQQPYEEAARIRLDDQLAARLEALMYTLTQASSERELKSAQFVAAARRAGSAEREAANRQSTAPSSETE